ncbi:MAG: 4-hydroxythreonine-4-phosphate dehydrogenase PdxA [Sphingopyxis sp.]
MQPLLVSLGDPAGIGPEVTARAWEARNASSLPAFIAVGDVASVRAIWGGPIAQVDSLAAGVAAFTTALPVWHVEDSGPLQPGSPTLAGAHCALHSLELGIGLARTGDAAGLVTAPISKDQLYQVGFTQAGQTEFIADRCGVSRCNAVMMLAGPGLRVVPITVHVPMRDVPALLTSELIVARTMAAARGMARSFGIENPRLAIAGFNPHAGENGAIGREEIEIIAPAVAQLQADGIAITGPHSPDALFTPMARKTYDAAMCLYHDQALIPLKALYFDEGVNLTLGLPIVRTSPDHGTAFGIAGTGLASPGPMIAAIHMAGELVANRARIDG